MILKYNKDIDIETLRKDISTLGEKFRILQNDGLEIEFFDIIQVVTNEVDENEEVINTITIYQKRHKETIIEDEEEKEIDVWEDYDFDKYSVDSIIKNHNHIEAKNKRGILKNIAETDSEFVRLVEDMASFLETNHGFSIPKAQKDRMSQRTNKRSQLV